MLYIFCGLFVCFAIIAIIAIYIYEMRQLDDKYRRDTKYLKDRINKISIKHRQEIEQLKRYRASVEKHQKIIETLFEQEVKK